MTDPLYGARDIFIDPGIVIKEEPSTLDPATLVPSSSMPIPARRAMDMSELRDFGFDLEASNSPLLPDAGSFLGSVNQLNLGIHQNMSNWNADMNHMDDDDIFQVDKADLIQGPTLAELNANDDTLLEDLNFDDLLLPEDKTYFLNPSSETNSSLRLSTTPLVQVNENLQGETNTNTTTNTNNNNTALYSVSFPQKRLGFYKESPFEPSTSLPSSPYEQSSPKASLTAFSPTSQHSSSSSLLLQSTSSPPLATHPSVLQQKHSTLHELLLKKEVYPPSPDHGLLGQSVPGPSTAATSSGGAMRHSRLHAAASRLSSSAPTHPSLDHFWQRREPRKHLLSTGSLAEAGSTSSLSTGDVLSPEGFDFSHDEGFDSDSDHYEDDSSDNDSDVESRGRISSSPSSTKKERFFWQYNVQAKGPKGQRLVLKTKLEDPHVLNEVTDPVFSPNCAVRGIKHSGKARKGDGNDLTPNPRKLFTIGKELDKLGKIINDMTPVSELPFNVRPKTRKEKNKLASRACRLKKKAQHEANKLKLHGLETEHRRLINGIAQAKQVLLARFNDTVPENQEELSVAMDKVVKTATKVRIAGYSTDYVNKVLDKVRSGDFCGGLDDI